jgi:glycosyltransferase involved in cell wall biosynthesis
LLGFFYSQRVKLSIIIPAKNEEKLLPTLLESIREQSFTDYEIILADANSTDDTRKLAASYGVRVVQGGMPGPGRKMGISGE